MPAVTFLLGLAFAIALAGCSGGSDDGSASEGVPEEVVGTYETTIEETGKGSGEDWSELGLGYRLWIAPEGGPDGAPSLSIDNIDSAFGNLESGASVEFFDNVYSYVLEGSTLTITEVENQCDNEVALTILTTNPWTKTSEETALPPS